MTTVLWRQFKEFSGCFIRGTDPIVPQDSTKHMSCAAWLTAEAEAPSYGTINAYDGAGISAGLLHNILVAPRDLTQGDLGLLVRRMLDALDQADNSNPALGHPIASQAFNDELRAKIWVLTPDGKFRFNGAHAPGGLVPGDKLRDWVAPPGGHVPQSGEDWSRAAKMATIFHDLFRNYNTRKVQEDFAVEWLSKGNRENEMRVYRAYVGQTGQTTPVTDPIEIARRSHAPLDSAIGLPVNMLPSSVHVAMCVYHSFSANSPAVAADCLARVVHDPATGRIDAPDVFAKALIRELGTRGRDVWHDQRGSGSNRYDRTRVALWGRSDLFPNGQDLMPQDL